jgi:hypothetical protein
LRKTCAVARAVPCQAAPRCVSQRRDSNPLYQGEVSDIFTTSVGLSRGKTRQTEIGLLRRCRKRAALCELSKKLALPSVSGSSPRSLRQAPRAQAARVSARAPGSGSPVPACAGQFSMSQRFGQQKTLRSSGSGGSANEQTAGPAFRQDPSHELGMRRRSAQSRSIVRRSFLARVALTHSCCSRTQILGHSCSRGRGTYALKCQMSTGKTVMLGTVGEMLRRCAYKLVASALRQANVLTFERGHCSMRSACLERGHQRTSSFGYAGPTHA